MLSKTLVKSFDKGRLQKLLLLFFMALAVPTAVLIWQAYSQLKWEAFHQNRGAAEELTRRIDSRLNSVVRTTDAYSFADFTFLIVSGDPSAKFVQQSPLSAFPVAEDFPGVLGYFQVDAEGVFSTPLLPAEGAQAASVGINRSEYAARLRLASEIQSVLADNRLLRTRQVGGDISGLASRLALPAAESEADVAPVARGSGEIKDAQLAEQVALGDEAYSQQVFDQLNQPRSDDRGYFDADGAAASGAAPQIQQRGNSIGKVSDLKLDAVLQKKSEDLERDELKESASGGRPEDAPGRSKRRERNALLESVLLDDSDTMSNAVAPAELRISTFESEIDPFEFSLLDSGHVVLFRKVWREGERYIQGLLVDQDAFTQDVIGTRFTGTAVASMSNLIVAHHDDVIRTFSGRINSTYSEFAADLDGSLLYRNRLTAPFDSLELIFSINNLPPGPGARVLAWVTLVLAIVFVAGFVTLYRLGLKQINLARQQQDFVSAVSHELKSPLTSIRMYGEMLKEGWAGDEKRQSYYEFIHDESERLSRLISNVLQLANITRNEPQFDLKPTTVTDVMINAESKIASQIERAGFKLSLNRDVSADQATINIDEDCFAQILINLVDNAIKFSRNAENKSIDISSRLNAENAVVFSVRDYGPGIPKDQMKKIFQLFYRSESELTRETVGTGIGLAIVHQLTLALGGSVDMINAEPGAEFRICFPVAESSARTLH